MINTLGFTGTQIGMSPKQREVVERIIKILSPRMGVHGGCIGADADFDQIITGKAICRKVRPASDVNESKTCDLRIIAAHEVTTAEPALIRNRKIVDDSDVMLATPRKFHEELRSGTWATIRYAKKQLKPLIIVWRDGSVSKYSLPANIFQALEGLLAPPEQGSVKPFISQTLQDEIQRSTSDLG